VQRLLLSGLLSTPVLLGLVAIPVVAAVALYADGPGAVFVMIPALLGILGPVTKQFVGSFEFTVADSPDGLRLRRGLIETRAQTVPPGRVQAVRIVEPWLWRRFTDWVRVEMTVAGYAGGSQDGAESTSLLLPVGPRAQALLLVGRVLPGIDVEAVPLTGVPARARRLDPLAWRQLALGYDENVVVARRGLLRRETDVMLHERAQSLRLQQGALQRRLGLASLHIDTTPGPVHVHAAHRDVREALEWVEREPGLARAARARAVPERWMLRPAGDGGFAASGASTRRTVAAPVPAEGPMTAATTLAMHDDEPGDRDPGGVGDCMGFDPWSPAFVANPYPAYARLRDEAPVAFCEATGQWLVSRYDDVNALLRDRRLGRSYLHLATHEQMGQPADPPHLDPFWHLVRDGMLDREPPDHTRLRRLVSKAFTPRMIDELRPRVHAIASGVVDDLLDAGSDGSPVDLKAIVAEPLPVTVIAEMLGVPEADRHLLRPWSSDICGMYELRPSREAQDTAVRASLEFSEYLRALSRERRTHPRQDLVSALTQVVDEGDRLTEDELIGTCVLLLNAGHEATVNVTTNGWWALFRNPEQLARVRAEPALLPGAVEELMRYDTPLQMFERWVLEDIEVRGTPIPRGVEVALLFGSANHDPRRFTNPERLDVTRADNQHISFGAGIHYCLGAPLAKLELQASYGEILRRVPRLALAEEPRWGPGYIIRGLERLMVTTT
jgi:cytochrome P450/membrane protein YdbS with pleckstrin-like domain